MLDAYMAFSVCIQPIRIETNLLCIFTNKWVQTCQIKGLNATSYLLIFDT